MAGQDWAGQDCEGSVISGREFPDFANDLETGLQGFPAEQAWSQSVLALCDTDVTRGKTLVARSPFLLTMRRPGKMLRALEAASRNAAFVTGFRQGSMFS